MPFYEYRCDNCEHELEALQKINDPLLVDCPVCGQAALKRLISAAAFRLKGSGWYETDFKKGGRKNLHDAGTKGGSGGTETKASDTKGVSGGEPVTKKPAEKQAAD